MLQSTNLRLNFVHYQYQLNQGIPNSQQVNIEDVRRLISKTGVTPDEMLLGIIDEDTILHFKNFMKHMDYTKAITYGVELSKLPNNTQPNTSELKNWCTTIEE